MDLKKWCFIFIVLLLGCKNKKFLAERIVYITDSVNVPYKFRTIDERYLFDKLGRTIEHTFYEEQIPEESTRFIYYSNSIQPSVIINNLNGDTIRNGAYDYRAVNLKLISNTDSLKCKWDSSFICEFKNGLLNSKRKWVQLGQTSKKQIVYTYQYNYKK